MKTIIALIIFLISINVTAQHSSAELMAGDKYLHYQHSLVHAFVKKVQLQHIATYITRYEHSQKPGAMGNEIMNQAYVAYTISKGLTVKGGMFYTNASGYKASLAVQLHHQFKDLTVVIAPRADITKNGAYEVFALAEYTKHLRNKISWYSRIQFMSSITKQDHSRSYQQLRLGLRYKSWQMGAGITTDEYGIAKKIHTNSGIFLGKKI